MTNPFIKYTILLLILLIGISTDLYTKSWAMKSLKGHPPVSVIDGLLECGYTENRGMVFGILNRENAASMHPILRYSTLIGTVLLLGYIFMNRKKAFFQLLPFTLLLTGAIGNSVDKLKYGFVVDFIHIQLRGLFDWPFFFNLADAFIVVGMILLILLVLSGNDNITVPIQNTKPPDA